MKIKDSVLDKWSKLRVNVDYVGQFYKTKHQLENTNDKNLELLKQNKFLQKQVEIAQDLRAEIEILKDKDFCNEALIEEIEKLTSKLNLLRGTTEGLHIQSELRELVEPKFIPSKNPRIYLKNKRKYKQELKEFKQRVNEYQDSLKSSLVASNKVSVKPESYQIEDRQIKVNDIYKRVYYLADLPNGGILPGMFFKILNMPIPMTISMHIKVSSSSAMIRAAKNTRAVLEAEQNDRSKKGKSRKEELDLLIDQANEFIEKLVAGAEKAFLVSIYISLEAENKEDIIKFHNQFKNTSEESLLSFNTYSYGQDTAYFSTLPFLEDKVKKEHIMQTTLVSYLMPFLTRNINDPDGIFLGRSAANGTLVLFDLFKARNANINILGTSGSGKSVTAKLTAIKLWLRQVQVIILDPEGEYGKITKAVDGETIKFSRQEGINPFYIGSFEDTDFKDHIQTLKHFFKFFIPEHHYDQATLDKALVNIYERGKPNYQELLKELKNSSMYDDLQVLETGSLSGIFNSDRSIDLNNDWVVFDLSHLESEEYKKPAMFLLASIVSRMIKNKDRRRMMFIDEAHVFLEDYNTALFYKNLVKRARKYKTGVVSITQNVEDYFNDRWGLGKSIITNAETSFLLKQSFASLEVVTQSFPVTDNEKAILPSLAQGEALLFRENEHMRINIIPLPSEQKLVFT